MKHFLLGLVVILGVGMLTTTAESETVIWSEDFSSVSDWAVIADQGGGSTITVSNKLGTINSEKGNSIYTGTSNNSLGAMYVDKSNKMSAFVPSETASNLIPFNPLRKSEYLIKWSILSLTDSVSWDIAIDQFNENKQYIDTAWNIYPSMGSTTEKGEFSKNLGEKHWNPSTRYIKPKITVHTGNPAQTVCFGYIKILGEGKLAQYFEKKW